jgi:hypothetical protein
MSDFDEFQKSNATQSFATQGTPYESKRWNYLNDLNNGVYQNNSQTLLQFDLSSLYTSGQFIDPANMYLVIPVVYTAAWAGVGGAIVAPSANVGNEYLITPKSGNYNMIHSVECIINGQTIVSTQPNLNIYVNFKILSSWSPSDLLAWGKTLGVCPDDVHSVVYNGAASAATTTVGPTGGNGLSNNSIFPVDAAGVAGTTSSFSQQLTWLNAGTRGSTYNTSLQERSRRFTNSITNKSNIYGSVATSNVMSQSQLNTEFRSNYAIANTNYMTWVDYQIVRLGDICDYFAQCPLVKGMSCMLRLLLNTGYCSTLVSKATQAGMAFTASGSTFVNTMPFTINQLPVALVPATVTELVVSCNIARSSVSVGLGSGNSINLSSSGASASMLACRIYYPMIKLQPEHELRYVRENRKKEILYRNILSNVNQGIASGATFNALIQSGVVNPKGLLVVPFLSVQTNGVLTTTVVFATPIVPFNQFSSPFDTAPSSVSPISLTQLNVSLGGLPILSYNYSATYENYLHEVSLYEKLSPVADYGLSTGLISQYMWESNYRYYFISLERGNRGDQRTARNVSLTCINNSLQTIDLYSFLEYYETRFVDVESGLLSS